MSLSCLAIGEDISSVNTVWRVRAILSSQGKCFELVNHEKRSIIELVIEDTHVWARGTELQYAYLEGVLILRPLNW